MIIVSFIGLGLSISSSSNQETGQGQLKVTLEHPFFVDNEWVEAGELEVGDVLKTSDGRKAIITSIEKVVDDVEVYNLHVDGPETYYANDVLVHNKPDIESTAIDFADWVDSQDDLNLKKLMAWWGQNYRPDGYDPRKLVELLEQSLVKGEMASIADTLISNPASKCGWSAPASRRVITWDGNDASRWIIEHGLTGGHYPRFNKPIGLMTEALHKVSWGNRPLDAARVIGYDLNTGTKFSIKWPVKRLPTGEYYVDFYHAAIDVVK